MESKTVYLLDTPQVDSVRDAEDGVAGSNVSNSPDLLPANIRIENTFLESSVYSFGWKWFILKEFLTAGDDGRMGIQQQQQHKKVPRSQGFRKAVVMHLSWKQCLHQGVRGIISCLTGEEWKRELRWLTFQRALFICVCLKGFFWWHIYWIEGLARLFMSR